ncbi:MAG: 5-formyltetrahydrofolate cyclo-ligase [Alistipes sp.]
MDKQELRRQMRQLNRGVEPAQRERASAQIFEQVARSESFVAARTVAIFASLTDEPDTAATLALWSRTKRIVVPRVEGDTMQFYDYDPEQMERGAFGIEEPQAVEPCHPAQIDLMIAPGVAFTREGLRLGRGRGYYDKYLSLPGFRAYKIGICYAHQLVPMLPTEPHDIRMDWVVCG